MLTSMESYRDSYRFRLTIEPAAILEPGFVLDRDALESVRAQQQRLVDGEIHTIGNAASAENLIRPGERRCSGARGGALAYLVVVPT
ncbi:hypothetical protein ACFXAE_34760 [Streptomyces sp. NPDC059454]|uniref:hypothetical protein n=1 Tax=Streptomyces sp. NPDC059454 TaxID=3346836 RepID=UPI0036A31E63